MSYIHKNVNFGLLVLLMILAVALAALGIYYNQNYGTLSKKYNDQVSNLQQVTEDLLFHKSRLNQTAADLQIQRQDESELSKRFANIRDENELLNKENKGMKQDLVDKSNSLLSAQTELTQLKITNAELEDDVDVYKSQSSKWKKKFEDACSAGSGNPDVDDICE